MKILVVSLLRLGDILLSTSVLRNLKRQYPNAEVHILINGQFAAVSSLIPYVEKVYSFERDALQQMIGTPDHGLLEAYFRIEDLVESLQAENYTKVINLTHNRLSGWLTTLVGCADTQGVVYNNQGRFSMGSTWFEYLNDHTKPSQDNVYHFVDVFHYGAGLNSADRRIEFQESEKGKKFVQELLASRPARKRLLLQTCSHESKKTFTSEKWKKIASLIQQGDRNLDVFVLGAPSEVQSVNEICKNTSFVPVIASLDEVYSLLLKCDLLLTVDTSIKHLASATKIKIVEVSLGSSEFRKTGVYTSGAVIIQGTAECAPCGHSRACHQNTHLCADKISNEMVALVTSALMRQDEGALHVLAQEFADEGQIYRTHINQRGDWSAYPIAQEFSSVEISRWVDRASSKLWMEKAHEKKVGEFGTEGVALKSLLENIFPDRPAQSWASELKHLEQSVSWLDGQIEGYLGKLKALLPHFDNKAYVDEFVDDLESFGKQVSAASTVRSYGLEIEQTLADLKHGKLPFNLVQKIRERLSFAHQRTKIEMKLIRGLQNDFKANAGAL